jgi:hypothetical protein
MKKFMVLLIIVSVIAGYYLYHSKQRLATVTSASLPLNQNKVDELSSFKAENPMSVSDSQSQSSVELSFNSDLLIHSPMKLLKSNIVLFWQQCQRANLCQQWLLALEDKLTEQRYQMVAKYPENQQQLALLLQDAQLNDSTEHKVSTVKAIYQQIWGEDAGLLFNKEFAFYDARVELSQLADNATLYQQSELLDLLDATTERNNISMTRSGAQDKYNQAVELLSAELNIEEQAHIKIALAERYFSAEHAESIAIRQEQIIEQQQQAQSYQAALAALKLELSQQRNSSLSSLSESNWQAHQSQAISEFRRAFFKP